MVPWKIVTISGRPGTGKSTLFWALHERHSESFTSVPSYTTREARKGDESSYQYITPEEFERLDRAQAFAWRTQFRGHWYGTRTEDLSLALERPEISLMILTPEYVKRLCSFVESKYVRPLYLLSPDDAELERRLLARGDGVEAVKKGLKESRNWDRTAARLSLTVPFRFLASDTKEGLIQHGESLVLDDGIA